VTRVPITGVRIELPTLCRTCRRGLIATIMDDGQGPASLLCDRCGAHRGHVSDISHGFFAEIIRNFTMPTEPAALRLGASSIADMTRAATDEDD
jgi:hypothetical protein